MITLIGHGYTGNNIAKKLGGTEFEWITHRDTPSKNTDFIINATGYVGFPNIDECEVNKDMCMEANVMFPYKLETLNKAPILHVSTGCVYDGYKEGGWLETDKPTFTFDNGSFYNGCKVMLQEVIEPYLSKSYLFRFRLPFGPKKDSRNLLTKLEMYNKLYDKENSFTQVEDLASCIVYFAKHRPPPGIYNVSNRGSTYLRNIAHMLDLNKVWMNEQEFKSITKVPRSNCVLNTNKLEQVFKMPSIEEALERTIKEYKK